MTVIVVVAAVFGFLNLFEKNDGDEQWLADYISGFVQLEDYNDVLMSASLSDVFSRVISESDHERECESSNKNSDFC